MALVEFKNIHMEFQGRAVLDGVSFELKAGLKVGLIGANGSGKTTILRILSGQQQANIGEVAIGGDVQIGYVPQVVTFEQGGKVLDYVLQDYHKLRDALRQAEHAVAQAHEEDASDERRAKQALHEYQQARDAYEQIGGDHCPGRAKALIDGLGLAGREDQQVELLSGGEQNVLAMSRALLAQPNLLLLDEPGNHLDYPGLAWLDDFLQRFRGAVLIVSHNRYLLDRIADGILELDKGKIEYYTGNYSAYRTQRAEKIKAQQAQYKAYQQRVQHLEQLVQKFADIAQGHSHENVWGKRLKARRSQLEREKSRAVDKPDTHVQQIKLKLTAQQTQADIAMQLRNYCKAFGELRLFEGVNWDITGGQRWALVGANGSGKTTLLRDIIEHGDWENKVIRIGPSLSVGYCAQQQEVLDGDNTVFEELISVKGTTNEQVLGILARFLFTDEEIYKKISNLSGGERNRLQLAKLMLDQPNFLILDEPTNHLDIPTREAVEEALKHFKGTLLVVSHDRYFMDEVVDHVAEVRDKQLHLYIGNFTNYWNSSQHDTDSIVGRVTTRGKSRKQGEAKTKAGGQAWQQRKAAAAELRKAQNAVVKIEHAIAETEAKKEQLETQIGEAFTAGENEKGHELSEQLKQVTAELERYYDEWMGANETLNAIENSE